jgi:hypothetical protein
VLLMKDDQDRMLHEPDQLNPVKRLRHQSESRQRAAY